jgi:hypothetical protein
MTNSQLKSGTLVKDSSTGFVGMLLGPFTRRNEGWWTVHWEEAETTAMTETEVLEKLAILQ